MAIRFHCPRCQARLKAPEGLAGVLGYCQKCGGTVPFPGERRLPAGAESALSPAERTARRQGLWDRLRPGAAQPWLISLALHAAAVASLAFLTWQVTSEAREEDRRVNILLEGRGEGSALRYRGPREIPLEQPPAAKEDLLTELVEDRPRSELIEVGPAAGAPILKLVDLDFARDPAGGGFSTRFMGLGARGRSFVYVVDKSGSMEVEGRLEAAKAELAASIRQLPYAAKFHVIFYDDPEVIEMPAQRLVNASRANKDRCFRRLASIEAGGGTDPTRALRKAFKLRPDVIFFLTDGELKSDTVQFTHMVRLMNRKHAGGKVTVHTIAFISDLGEKVLRRIAADNHGSYRFVSAAAARRLLRRPTGGAGP